MPENSVGELFQRAAGHAARYRDNLPDGLQRPQQNYREAVQALREPLPEQGGAGLRVLDELVARVEPGIHAMTGPRFFGWVIGGSHPVGVAADWMTSAWGQNAGNHHAAPSRRLSRQSPAAGCSTFSTSRPKAPVGFVTGATMANFVCLAAARGDVLRKAGWDAEAHGLFGAPPITVLVGDDAHTTVFSALQFLGLGHDRVIRIETDRQGRMIASDFAEAAQKVSGPSIAILQAGQINTGDFDDFAAIVPTPGELAAGSMSTARSDCGRAPVLDEGTWPTGVETADSWATDGHKWLQTPYDCGYAIVRNEEAHRRAMTIAASYLPTAFEGERDPSHFVPELSRRARGFATWAMIKHLGREGIATMVERHCQVARAMAEKLRADNAIAVENDVVLNQFLVRFGADRPDDEADRLTLQTIAKLQQDGICFAGGAKWRGRQCMRVSVISWLADAQQGERAADAMIAAWRAVR